MNQDDLPKARHADLRGSLAAMRRAASAARDVAMKTNTGIAIVRDGQRVHIPADELRQSKG